MKHLANEYPVRWLCRLFDCPRAGLYRTATEATDEAARIADLERLVGQQALELAALKKASTSRGGATSNGGMS